MNWLSRVRATNYRSAPGRIRTADASLRTAALYPLSYGGEVDIVRRAVRQFGRALSA
jgi:hypothetical protein